MNYAKWVSDELIQVPVADDYLEDGVTLKTPEEWSEYIPSDMPTDGTIFKSYKPKYVLMSDAPLSTSRRIIVGGLLPDKRTDSKQYAIFRKYTYYLQN